jgi:hypothetical protein
MSEAIQTDLVLVEETVTYGLLIGGPVARLQRSCTILGRRQAPITKPEWG